MTLPVFRAAPLPAEGPYCLDGAEGRHAAAVRRLRAGEALLLVDGEGGVAEAVVTAAGRDTLDVEVSSVRREARPSPGLTVVQALAKGEHAERAVDLLTEVGVDVIVPWSASRSVVRWEGERGLKARARWQAVADAASKQSRRSWWPQVAPPTTTAEVAALLTGADVAVVLHESATEPLSSLDVSAARSIVLVVGPEGGIAPDELDAIGGVICRLGPEVLRTSSAGMAAASALLSRTTRWV
jgi:16S rRNA (uracil1498-N3)-methyltransferase